MESKEKIKELLKKEFNKGYEQAVRDYSW